MKDYILDIAGLAGLLILCYGVWLIYKPAAFIVFGVAILLFCFMYAKAGKK